MTNVPVFLCDNLNAVSDVFTFMVLEVISLGIIDVT